MSLKRKPKAPAFFEAEPASSRSRGDSWNAPSDARVPRDFKGKNKMLCCHVQASEGGAFGCELLAGHSGPHILPTGQRRCMSMWAKPLTGEDAVSSSLARKRLLAGKATEKGVGSSSSSSSSSKGAMKNRPGEYRGGVPLPRQQLKQLQQRKSKPANKKPAEKREKPPKPQKERKEPKPATDAPLTRLGLSPAERINVHVAVLGLQEANGGRRLSERALRPVAGAMLYTAGKYATEEQAAEAMGTMPPLVAAYRRRLEALGLIEATPGRGGRGGGGGGGGATPLASTSAGVVFDCPDGKCPLPAPGMRRRLSVSTPDTADTLSASSSTCDVMNTPSEPTPRALTTRRTAKDIGAAVIEAAWAASPRTRLVNIAESGLSQAARDAEMIEAGKIIEEQCALLEAMSYDELCAERKEWLNANVPEVLTLGKTQEVLQLGKWSQEWANGRLQHAIKGRPVLKKFVLGGFIHAINFGKVVGCEEHFFQVRAAKQQHAAAKGTARIRITAP